MHNVYLFRSFKNQLSFVKQYIYFYMYKGHILQQIVSFKIIVNKGESYDW